MSLDLTRAEVRIRISNAADELSKITIEQLANVFHRWPELKTKCQAAIKAEKEGYAR
jgi:hypothetical protein